MEGSHSSFLFCQQTFKILKLLLEVILMLESLWVKRRSWVLSPFPCELFLSVSVCVSGLYVPIVVCVSMCLSVCLYSIWRYLLSWQLIFFFLFFVFHFVFCSD